MYIGWNNLKNHVGWNHFKNHVHWLESLLKSGLLIGITMLFGITSRIVYVGCCHSNNRILYWLESLEALKVKIMVFFRVACFDLFMQMLIVCFLSRII